MTTDVRLMGPDEFRPAPAEDAGIAALHTERGNLPLEEIDVRAAITGLAVRTDLTQTFRNPFTEPLEAVYIFPLPDRAAVTTLRLTADGRVIEGVLKERGEARADFDAAMEEGKRASLLEEDRPGVFTIRVGNILPGERVTVSVGVVGRLPYEDGAAAFRFPLVVAPRYIPGTPLPGGQVGDGNAADTDAVPDASRISPPVLLPGFPNPVRLSALVEVDPASVAGISSSLPVTAEGNTLRLLPGERLDRDFVLRMELGAADSVVTSLATQPDGDGGTFAITVLPPATSAPARPRDVVLVLDRSGSMDGWKIAAARRAAARIVDTLTAADRFAVLAFDNVVEAPPRLPHGLVAATDRNRFRAVEYLTGLAARGGTEMLAPLSQAVTLLAGEPDRDRVLVLVTDGQIGNEDQILRSLAPLVAPIRVHTVGIDTAVNAAFLHRLAGLSGGRCELVESEDRLDEAMRSIHHRIGAPLVTGLAVRGNGLRLAEGTLAPARLPDLFPGAAVVISGRYDGHGTGGVLVSGTLADGTVWHASISAVSSENTGLPAVWARARIRDLEDTYVTASSVVADLEREIVAVSLRFGVLSRFTAFVAVDQRVVTEGGERHVVTQPVELPHGWEPVPMEPMMCSGSPMQAAKSRGRAESARGYVANAKPVEVRRGPAAPPVRTAPVPGPAPAVPLPVVPVVPVSVREFATRTLRRLSELESRPVPDRSRWLAKLARDIHRRLGGFRADGLPEPAIQLLRDLAGELTAPTDVDHRWQRATTTLRSLVGAGPAELKARRFWTR